MDKDLRRILDALNELGYGVVRTKGGHYEVRTSDGSEKITTFAGTASDRRSVLNALAPLKRRGFRWPPSR